MAFRTVLGLDRAEPIVLEGGEGNEGSVQAVVFASVAGLESTRTREESLGGTF